MATYLGEGKPVKLSLKIDLVSYPACMKRLDIYIYIDVYTPNLSTQTGYDTRSIYIYIYIYATYAYTHPYRYAHSYTHIHICNAYMHIYSNSARGVMVIVVGIGHDDTSSNSGRD